MKAIYTLLATALVLLSPIAGASPEVVGDYHTDGAHPWNIAITEDHRFTFAQSDAAGNHFVQGAWLLDQAVLHLLTKADDTSLTVFMRFQVLADARGEAVLQTISDHPSYFLKSALLSGWQREPSIEDVVAGDVGVLPDIKIIAKKLPNQRPEGTSGKQPSRQQSLVPIVPHP